MTAFVILLVAGLICWLVARDRSQRNRVEELRWRQDRTEAELARLRQRLEAVAASQPNEASVPAEPAVSAAMAAKTATVSPPPLPRAPVAELVPPGPPKSVPAPVSPVVTTTPTTPPRPVTPWPAVPPPPVPAVPKPTKPAFNWEQFLGVKLVAWLAGLALFLAAAFGLKYSFEQGLIPPAVRAGAGFVLGAGLIGAGSVLRRRAYAVTAQTLTATGVVILYAVTFACRSLYHFAPFGPTLTFTVMAAITALAFGLAVRADAQVIAVLGMVGGFLTPVLVSTGEDNPVGLFGYLAFLDVGLLALAQRKRWHYLALAAAAGTVLMQFGWTAKFFEPDKLGVLQVILPGFTALFAGAFAWTSRREEPDRFLTAAAAGMALVALGLCFQLVATRALADFPGRIFGIAFFADVALLALVTLRPNLRALESLGGGAVFLLLSVWTGLQMGAELLPWSLGLTVAFAGLHTAFPLALRRRHSPALAPAPVWSQFFPALALLLVLIPLLKSLPVGPLFWGVIVTVDALAIGLALLSGALLGLIAVVVLTFALAGIWLGHSSAELADATESLFVIGGFGVFLAAAGAFVARKLSLTTAGDAGDPRLRAAAPVLSATLPFLLLILLVQRLHPANPSAVFGVAFGLGTVLLGLARWTGFTGLTLAGLGATALLEWAWIAAGFQPSAGAALPLAWNAAFTGLFFAFPFAFRRHFQERKLPWAAAALAGVLHLALALTVVKTAWPALPPGVVPAVYALPALGALGWLARRLPTDSPNRLQHLAWFAGAGLLGVTLIFPVQFDRQWLTLGWALEGAALCWLFHRLPHPGLRATGVALLLIAFGRLALNPAILTSYEPSGRPLLNWYLYTYGLVTATLFAGGRLLAPPRERVFGSNASAVLHTLGTVLAFLLVNVEIADYFSPGGRLVFEFSGNFARDLAYTVAWALFALGLIFTGVWKRVRGVRYSGLALLGVVVLKLFLHDLANLSQLYRIIAFAAFAVIALAASMLYQRFLAETEPSAK